MAANWLQSETGSTGGEGVSEICIMTYNILAAKYGRTSFFAHCPPELLAWESRYPRILSQIQAIQPDILALQEVENKVFAKQLVPDLAGYKGHFYARAPKKRDPVRGPPEGPCLFIREDKFEVLQFSKVRFASLVEPERQGLFWNLVKKREDGAVLAVLQERSSGRKLVAVSTHLFWDPKFPDVKVAQAELLCRWVANTIQQAELTPDTPFVIAGDFNSLWRKYESDCWDQVLNVEYMTSGTYELLSTGSLPPGAADHPAQRRGAQWPRSDAVPGALTTSGLPMESAMFMAHGREPPVTNCTESFRGCLDYVWLRRGSWHVQATLAMPYNEDAGPHPKDIDLPPLPNADHPSDHLPIACKVCAVEPKHSFGTFLGDKKFPRRQRATAVQLAT